MALLTFVRERFHPLYKARRFKSFRRLVHALDFPVSRKFSGISHPIYLSASKNFSWLISPTQPGEERERCSFLALAAMGNFRTFADVGAHLGFYGFLFRSLPQAESVVMVEADRHNAALIRQTLERFKVPGVDLVEGAISDVLDQEVTFYCDDIAGATGSIARQGADSFVSTHYGYEVQKTTVRTITLDHIYDGARPDPEFIKMDVESAELQALRGAENLLKRAKPAIFFECEANPEAVQTLLADHGYVLFDFVTLKPIPEMVRNNLALHAESHGNLIQDLARTKSAAA